MLCVTMAQCILPVTIRCEGKEGSILSPWLSAYLLLLLDVRARKEALCHHGSVHIYCCC